TGREDLPVGTPIANRNRAETEELIGFFVNTLVLRGDLSGDPTFQRLLERTREAALAAYDHQDLPFEKLVEALQPERSLSWTPIFQVMFLLQNDPPGDVPELGGLTLSSLRLAGGGTAKFDLTVAVAPMEEGCLAVQAEYSRDLFDAPTVLRSLEHFRILLGEAAAMPERRVSELSSLTESERHELLREWNDTAVPYPDRTIQELFAEQARRTPEAVAVLCEGRSLSYAELDRHGNRLAHHLRRLGVGPEARVGICVERSLALVVGLLGILKAGGAYLPLDPSLPAERLAFLLDDGRLTVLLTEERLLSRFVGGAARVVCLDRDGEAIGRESDAEPAMDTKPRGLAYVLYTSGSTGQPKGVAVEHRSIVRLVRGVDYADFCERETFLQLAPIPFDASTLEIWGPLLNGGRLVVFPARTPSLEELGETLRTEGISTLWLTAGLFHQMVEAQPESLAGVRQLLAGGDTLSLPHVRQALARLAPGHRLINGYGPTEGTTFTCCHSMDAASPVTDPDRPVSSVPIGRPISNTRVYLLDSDLQPVPIGVPGELHAAGDGLARGYLDRPEQTAERFVPSPLPTEPGERLYRTGDLARRLPSGEIEFLGRIDTQVKLRGFRIELGEIEAALAAHPAVRESAVLAREDRPGDRRLVAYVAPGEGTAVTGPELRSHLARKLPDYMIPATFVQVSSLPLTSNGKVDRRALASVEIEPEGAPGGETGAPCDAVEELLAEIWCDVLGRAAVGVRDDFFDLGGHSLLATRVVSRIREAFGVELPLRALFEALTVAGLAERLRAGSRVPAPPIVPRRREGRPPASFAQERLWFLDQLGDERASYNIPIALSLRGPLDPAALGSALTELVARHEALRTTFASEEGRVVQVIAPPFPLPLPVVDLERRSEEVWRLAREEAARPFDLSRGPLLRTTLLRLGSEEHLLLLTMHHIVSDGWSIGVLLRELSALYDGLPLPELPVQYADFAIWQREWLAGEVLEAQLGYWRERLAGALAVLELPADRPRPVVRSAAGGQLSAGLSSELSEDLDRLARRRGATLFRVLLAAFQGLLSRLTGQEDLTVGSPVANRNRAETEGLIGFFVNTLVLRGDLSGDPGFGELLARTRESALGAYAHQDLPFEKLVAELQPERDLAHSPLFQVMLIVQNFPGAAREGWRLSAPPGGQGTAKFDLTLSFGTTEGGRVVLAEYRRDLFDAPTVDRLLGCFTTLLAAAVAEPERRLSELPLLSEREVQQLLREWNDTCAATGPDLCLHERFEAQVDRTPEAEALVCGEERLTYAELDRRANRLARGLRRLGVGPEVRVGIALPRTAELVVGLLAILKAGGAYVPLDPASPRERLAMILEDARASLVLTPESLPHLPPETSGERLGGTAGPGNLAYLIYTSGSTGRPKGVAIEHRSAAALLDWAAEVFVPEELEGVLAATSVAFDLSVFEIFLPLTRGGT
ncbi:MAG TPA: amino acid adenylation domain-containing protein, partial [Thermoanaerobaculia bacterium]|nr:amino acid adenylation domain-containing protein [Thermoanaerobaculia bacterium]